MVLEMLKNFRARVFANKKSAISNVSGYCALFKNFLPAAAD
jgi:hypothetical protein